MNPRRKAGESERTRKSLWMCSVDLHHFCFRVTCRVTIRLASLRAGLTLPAHRTVCLDSNECRMPLVGHAEGLWARINLTPYRWCFPTVPTAWIWMCECDFRKERRDTGTEVCVPGSVACRRRYQVRKHCMNKQANEVGADIVCWNCAEHELRNGTRALICWC